MHPQRHTHTYTHSALSTLKRSKWIKVNMPQFIRKKGERRGRKEGFFKCHHVVSRVRRVKDTH